MVSVQLISVFDLLSNAFVVAQVYDLPRFSLGFAFSLIGRLRWSWFHPRRADRSNRHGGDFFHYSLSSSEIETSK